MNCPQEVMIMHCLGGKEKNEKKIVNNNYASIYIHSWINVQIRDNILAYDSFHIK